MTKLRKSLLEWALYHAGLGYRLFPLAKNSKVPIKGIKWKEESTADPDQINKWWSVDDYNIGIVTGKVNDITVIDLDGDAGVENYKKLKEDYKIPDTYVVQTPHGYHHYFHYNAELKQGAGLLTGIDIRNDGGYIVGAGSVIEDKGVWDEQIHDSA